MLRQSLIIYAHPYPGRSRANRALIEAASSLEGVRVRSLYDLYPDFSIDVEAEQAALASSDVIVLQHPLYWYSAPALLKLWFEKVLERGWAFGAGGTALAGKRCLWAPTTGGDERAYSPSGIHQHPFSAFVPVVEQTVRLCHMRFEEPFVVHGSHKLSHDMLIERAEAYRDRVRELATERRHA